MEARTTLPLDVLLYIIDLLAVGDCGDFKSLQTLSQTCKSMVPLCRKHLFSSLAFGKGLNSIERFSDLLSKNPDIARYVKTLLYNVIEDYENNIHDHIIDCEMNIFNILNERSSLLSIDLSSEGSDWNDLPESIRSSLVFLIQLPTVTHLTINRFKGFPTTALSGCSNLIDLQLRDLELAPNEVNHVIWRIEIPTPVSLDISKNASGLLALLNSTSLHLDGPIVDLTRLQTAEFEVEYRDDIVQVNELIKMTTRLEHFIMCISMNRECLALSLILQKLDRIILVIEPLELAELGSSLAINAYRTLKSLIVGVTVVQGDDHDSDPLCGLNRELKFIAGNNILEELELNVGVQEDAICRTDSEQWPTFDSLLTESGAFPMLHRVSVGIWFRWDFESVYTGRELKEQMESSMEDKFPRLVESKVEFNFFVNESEL